jgi:hypothetical protein
MAKPLGLAILESSSRQSSVREQESGSGSVLQAVVEGVAVEVWGRNSAQAGGHGRTGWQGHSHLQYYAGSSRTTSGLSAQWRLKKLATLRLP